VLNLLADHRLKARLLRQPHRHRPQTRNHIHQLDALGYTVTLTCAA
jgi:hypothetical protein